MYMKNKTIIIMGGGSAGWIASTYFLNKSEDLNLNLKVKLIASELVGTIGVGEGTTPNFSKHFIEKICKVDKKEFLRETKGSFKYGIKFDNWNFDGQYYYHLFNSQSKYDNGNLDVDYKFIQYIINEELKIPQKILQKKLHKSNFDLLENNKISLNYNNDYAYHFSSDLLITFLKDKCLKFKNFNYKNSLIKKLNYSENNFIKSIYIENDEEIEGDFFVNCLGFRSNNLLNEQYFDIKDWSKYILNNSALAIQVSNNFNDIIEPYTTSTAEEYGWSWKIPQYEKTGYGYVYSDYFITDEDKLYENIIKTYKIKEKNIFKTKVVKSNSYYNRKQINNNCLSLGLASGFIEPLEATSIHMTLAQLYYFFEMVENNVELNEKYINVYNKRLEKNWENIFKFVIFHYFTNNPINEYWQHYVNICESNEFDFYEKYSENNYVFSSASYFSVSLGMNIKDYYYDFYEFEDLKNNLQNYLHINTLVNFDNFYSQDEILSEINNIKVNYI
jgi:hypothetical protein